MTTLMNGWGRRLGWYGTAVSALLLSGCGGGDDEGKKDRPKSYEAAREAIESPTGTVDATSAKAIGPEFEKLQNTSVNSPRDDWSAHPAQTVDISYDCGDSGKVSTTSNGDQNNLTISLQYDNCCQYECCINGSGEWYYANLNSTSTGDLLNFSYCGSYDLTTTCGLDVSSVVYAGCITADGWTYAIEVNGESFAVSGYYSAGSGSLTIRGANGTWECTYTDYSGTCTGPDGEISF